MMARMWRGIVVLICTTSIVVHAETPLIDVICDSTSCKADLQWGVGPVTLRIAAKTKPAVVLRTNTIVVKACGKRGVWCADVDEALLAKISFGGLKRFRLQPRQLVPSTDTADPIFSTQERPALMPNSFEFFVNGPEVSSPVTPLLNGSPVPSVAELEETFPDVVAVGSPNGFFCSGVVVATNYVLTARHCLPATRVAVAWRVSEAVRAVGVTAAIEHPELDAALLRTDASLGVRVRDRRAASDREAPRGALRLVGFGVNSFRSNTGFGTKREADVITRGWGCDGDRPRRNGCNPIGELLATPEGGRDTCSGDSGGAALERHENAWRLIAITSRAAVAGRSACGGGGIYVRADVLAPWIDSVLNGESK